MKTQNITKVLSFIFKTTDSMHIDNIGRRWDKNWDTYFDKFNTVKES